MRKTFKSFFTLMLLLLVLLNSPIALAADEALGNKPFVDRTSLNATSKIIKKQETYINDIDKEITSLYKKIDDAAKSQKDAISKAKSELKKYGYTDVQLSKYNYITSSKVCVAQEKVKMETTKIRYQKLRDTLNKNIADNKKKVQDIQALLKKEQQFVRPCTGAANMKDGYYGASRDGGKRKHVGQDYYVGISKGKEIYAVQYGTAYTKYSSGYGNYVELKSPNGVTTIYAHLSGFSIKNGAVVKKGTKIGTMGNTGNSFGTHLHFEVKVNGENKNPITYSSIFK